MWLRRIEDGYELLRNGGQNIHTMCLDFEWALGFSMKVGQKQRVRFSVEPVGKLIEPKRMMILGDVTRGTGRPWFRRWPEARDNNPQPFMAGLRGNFNMPRGPWLSRDGNRLVDADFIGPLEEDESRRWSGTLAQHMAQSSAYDESLDFSSLNRAQRFAFLYGAGEQRISDLAEGSSRQATGRVRSNWPRGGSFGLVHPEGGAEIVSPSVTPAEIRSDRLLSEPIITAVREEVYQDVPPPGRRISQIQWGGQPNRSAVVYGRAYDPDIVEEGEW